MLSCVTTFKENMLITYNDNISPFTQQQEEVCWQIPKELGRGKINKIRIRPGLELCLVSCTLTKELMFRYKKHLPLLLFTYNLQGEYRVRFTDQQTDTNHQGEHFGEFYHGQCSSTWHLLPSRPNKFVSFAIYREFLDHCTDNKLELPEIVTGYLHGSNNASVSFISEISPLSNEIVHEILACPFTGIQRKLFLESKFLCLIAAHLEHKAQKYN